MQAEAQVLTFPEYAEHLRRLQQQNAAKNCQVQAQVQGLAMLQPVLEAQQAADNPSF
jgi:hypothetical protein